MQINVHDLCNRKLVCYSKNSLYNHYHGTHPTITAKWCVCVCVCVM